MSVPYIFEICAIDLNGTFIICIYRPRNKYNDDFIKKMENLFAHITKHKERKIIACGDYNVDTLITNNESRDFFCLLNSFNLKRFIYQPTRITNHSQTCIDNIISNVELSDAKVIEVALSDHTLQSANITVPFKQKLTFYTLVRNLNHDNLDSLKEYLLTVSWEEVYTTPDYEQAFEYFHDILVEAFNKYCPEIKIKNNSCAKDLGWLTTGIKTSCATKRDLYVRVRV